MRATAITEQSLVSDINSRKREVFSSWYFVTIIRNSDVDISFLMAVSYCLYMLGMVDVFVMTLV